MWCVFCARFGAGGVAYFSCGRVPIAGCVFCVWLSSVDQCVAGFLLRGCILRTAAVCCVVREVWPNGRGVFYVRLGLLVCVFIFGRVFGGCLGVVVLACSVRGFGFILFVMRWIIPLCLILTAFFPPFPGASAETSAQKPLIFRVQCLWGRADVWSARAVGATILDVFGYGAPHGKWRRLPMAVLLLPRARGREPLGKGHGLPGKICLYPPLPTLKYNIGAEKGRIFPLKYNAGTDKGGVFPRAGF